MNILKFLLRFIPCVHMNFIQKDYYLIVIISMGSNKRTMMRWCVWAGKDLFRSIDNRGWFYYSIIEGE